MYFNKENTNIFLATDSIDALNYFKSLNLNIYNFTELSDKNIAYHYSKNKDKLLNTISDLVLLGLGNDFILPKVFTGYYTTLAYFLYQNKEVLNNFIDNKISCI
jgi:hypothetical protein